MTRVLRLLTARRLRAQPLRALLAACAVAAGTSLGLSVTIVTSSITASLVDFGRAVAGSAPLRLVGATPQGGLDPAVVAGVARAPGVAAVVPMVQAVTLVDSGAGGGTIPVVALGVDCSVQALVGRFGCDERGMAATAAIVSPALSRVATGGDLRHDQGALPLTGALTLPALQQVNHGRVVVLPLARARQLFDRGDRVDVAYLVPAPGHPVAAVRAAAAAAAGPADAVLSATEPPAQAAQITANFVPLLGMLAILAFAIAGVLVYNVVSLSLEERRQQHALVAAIGAPPRILLAGPLLEAAAVGAAGGIAGIGGGLVLAGPIARTMSQFTVNTVGVPVTVRAGAGTLATGLVFGVVLGLVAAARPVRRAMRLDVAAELSGREAAAESAPPQIRRRAFAIVPLLLLSIVALLAGRAGGGLDAWQPGVARLGFVGLTVASVLGNAVLAPVLVRAARRRARGRRTLARLGLANLARDPGRTGVMALAVSAAVGVAFITASFDGAAHRQITDSIVGHTHDWVSVTNTGKGRDWAVDAGMPPALLDRLAAVPGVARVERSEVILTGHRLGDLVGVVGVDRADSSTKVLSGLPPGLALSRGEAMIGAALARQQHVRPGGPLRLDTPGGVVTLPVGGIWDNLNFNGDAAYIPLALMHRWYGLHPPSSVTLRAAPGVSPDVLAARVTAAHLAPGLRVLTPPAVARETAQNVSSQMAPFWALQRALILVAFVAVLSTLLLVGVQRRREMGLLAAVGMGPGELVRMVLSEAGAVGLAGVVLGVLFGLVGLFGMVEVAPVVLGWQLPFRAAGGSLLTYGVVSMAVVVLAGAWPGWRAARLPVLEALQYE